MKSFHQLITVLLFLIGVQIHLLSADQSSLDSVSAILKSYADTFTSTKPSQQPTTPVFLDIAVKSPSDVYNFSANKVTERHFVPLNLQSTETNSDPTPSDYDNYSSLSYEASNEDEGSKEPPDHVVPFSEHENPKEPLTKPNYTAPGEWAKPPAGKNIKLDFVPTKLYAQVRGSHTIKHLPQEDAIKSAETDEEKENAARLKEVVKETKANTVYTEEGYEDAAYDHAGQIRDADFHEGFAKKLNEELLERKKNRSGKRRKPKKSRKHRSRRGKSRKLDNFDDYNDQEEITQEARTSKQQVKPEDVRVLKEALSKSVIDPKTIAENGISQLERDLREESLLAQRTSTELYASTSTSTERPSSGAESFYQDKINLETSTQRRDIFTVRPRKPMAAVKPPSYFLKPKRPMKLFTTSKNNDNHRNYETSLYSNQPTTINYGNTVWQYLLNKNETPTVTYRPTYIESQTVNPVLANPLAVATVNGHGPYLVVVTAAPEGLTASSSDHQSSETTIRYVTAPTENVTRPVVSNRHRYQSPHLSITRKVKYADRSKKRSSKLRSRLHSNQPSNPKLMRYDIYSSPKHKPLSPSSPHKSNYPRKGKTNYKNYYTLMKPPVPNDLIGHPEYSHDPAHEQWSVNISESDVESVYVEDPEPQKTTLPVTRLLPPSPLSTSEYLSFHGRNKNSKPITPAVMAMVPIIEAIHKNEHEPKYFPFLFRRKRSTLEYSQPQRSRRHQQSISNTFNGTEGKVGVTKYPTHFNFLLNEFPRIATKVVDEEIKKKFQDKPKNNSEETSNESGNKASKEYSREASNESSNKASEEYSSENSREKSKEGINSGEKNIEVEIPELDFSVFEAEQPESTTKKSGVDSEKYPFYRDNKVANTVIKYAANPKEIPRKTLGGMEFYNSRNLECEEVNPNLESVVPEEAELAEKRGPRKSKPRLHGLGDKIDCYRAKYFDANPLDNPLFLEKDVEIPSPPTELNAKKFASRILQLPPEKDEYIVSKGPKYPEYIPIKRNTKLKVNSPRQYSPELSGNYINFARTKRPISSYRNRNRNQGASRPIAEPENRIKFNRTRIRGTKRPKKKDPPPYERLVYEDVMDTIMNMEKMKKVNAPKRSAIPVHAKHHYREKPHANNKNNRHNSKSNIADKTKTNEFHEIEGLVPPPKYSSFLISPYVNSNNPVNTDPRYTRQSSNEAFAKSTRIFKREVNINDADKGRRASNKTSSNKRSAEVPFRIVLTTPKSEQAKAATIASKPLTAKRMVYTIHDRIKHSNRSFSDPGRYDKFSNNGTLSPSVDTRRQEPRYNRPNIRNITAIERKTPEVTLHLPSDPPISSSTLVPVIIKLDNTFTPRIPQESKKQYVKESLQNPREVNNQRIGDTGIPRENPKDDYLNFEDLGENNSNTGREINDVIPVFTAKPHEEEHKELYDFLAGEPPGYTKAFNEGEDVSERESKSRETLDDQETQNNANVSTGEDKEEEEFNAEDAEEPYEAAEESSNNSDDDTAENSSNQSEKENSNAQSRESGDEPFVRYSSRPYSPPENYEDEKYADIGPRVNKPYFYHPPFAVPDYERDSAEKAADHSTDDHEQNEETEDHEKYVFPWAHDEDDDEEIDGGETQDHSISDRYEYPWERRERKAKERKQKMKKYNTKLNYGEKEDDNSEATNIKPIYIPLKEKHFRDKKDVHNEEITLDYDPPSKFSSKYKSENQDTSPIDDEIAVENTDEIKQSILSYLESAKPSKFRPKKAFLNSTTDSWKSNDKNNNETSTSKPPSNTTTSRSSRSSRYSISPSSTTSNPVRGRSRRTKVHDNSSGASSTSKLSSRVVQNQTTSSSPTSRGLRRRGRNGSNINLATTSTTSSVPTHSNTRRKGRPLSSQSVQKKSAAIGGSAERRRKPLKVVGGSTLRTNQSRFTTPSVPTSTGKTIETHSRVSKEMIITKTVSNDDEDEDAKAEAKESAKAASETVPVNVRLRRRGRPKNVTEDEPAKKKERVEKVTITMEETPEHVYKTKEVDKDGIKGKFVTITANNNTDASEKINEDEIPVGDAEMEEMKRRMEAYKSFDSEIKDTEDLVNEPSGIHATEKYVDDKLSKKSSLSSRQQMNSDSKTSAPSDDEDDEEDDEDYDEEDEEDVDEEDEEDDVEDIVEKKKNDTEKNKKNSAEKRNDTSNEAKEKRKSAEPTIEKSTENIKHNSIAKKDDVKVDNRNTTERAAVEKLPADFIKDPKNRNYFYVEPL